MHTERCKLHQRQLCSPAIYKPDNKPVSKDSTLYTGRYGQRFESFPAEVEDNASVDEDDEVESGLEDLELVFMCDYIQCIV